ncbi:MAG: IS110 family transposase, partial [Calditrichaeota bacterium]
MAKYYLGIDVSKGYADFLLLDARKQAVEEGFQLDDTHQGHRRLGAYLSRFIQQHPDAVVYAAVESTGGYENNWYGCLRALGEDLPVQVARLNPAWVKFHHQACARCNKTDAISAREIAEFQIAHPEQIRYNEPEEYPMLRRQWNFLQLLLKQRTQLSNHLQALLYITMPELLPYCREGVPRWLLKVVEQYPTYQAMKAAGVIGLSEIPHLSARKAEALLARIEEGIGHSNETSGQLIATLAQQILALDGEIERQKKLLEQLLEQNCQEARDLVKLLCTFPGIGTYSAVGLLLNIGNIHRFPTAKHLASYAGVHPVYKQSGDGQWGIHMSK